MSTTKHWFSQRLSAILLLPLSYFLLDFLRYCFQKNYFDMTEWLVLPFNKIGLIAWVIMMFYHAALGIQVVLEDYVTHQKKRFFAIWLINVVFTGLALSAVVVLMS